MAKQRIFAISLDASRYTDLRYWWVSVHRAESEEQSHTIEHKVNHYHGVLTPSTRARIHRAQEALMSIEKQ